MTEPAVPGVEGIRRIIDDALNSAIPEPWEVSAHAAQRILDLFAPILAEKERDIRQIKLEIAALAKELEVERTVCKHRGKMIQEAEAALAGERERCAKLAERYDQGPGDDSVKGPVMAGQVAVAQSIASAIRSGEAP